MIGLVGYGSSDEDDSVDKGRQMQLKSQPFDARQPEPSRSGSQRPLDDTKEDSTVASAEDELNKDYLGPQFQGMTPESSAVSAPASPHAKHHATLRSLTLPAIPNLDIPQSPLGLPTPGANPRFSQFLGLKKHGIHFNTKLACSSALKNPSLLPRLMVSAGLSSEQQYTTSLPSELWNPLAFPTWAYKEELAEAQHILSKKKEDERVNHQRGSIEFIAAGTPAKPSGLVVPRGSKASAAERLMAGLDKYGNRHRN